MRRRTGGLLAGALAAALVTGGPAPGAACPAAGPDGHIGQVTELDGTRGLLIIRDAETGHAVRFRVTAEQLKGIAAGETVLVKFRKEGGGGLAAVSIRPF